jgi:hypothetical protein
MEEAARRRSAVDPGAPRTGAVGQAGCPSTPTARLVAVVGRPRHHTARRFACAARCGAYAFARRGGRDSARSVGPRGRPQRAVAGRAGALQGLSHEIALPRAERRLRERMRPSEEALEAMVRDGTAKLGQRLALRWVSERMEAEATAQCGVSKKGRHEPARCARRLECVARQCGRHPVSVSSTRAAPTAVARCAPPPLCPFKAGCAARKPAPRRLRGGPARSVPRRPPPRSPPRR